MPKRKPEALLPRERAILECVADGTLHGWAIAALAELPTSTTYNALRRLDAMGLVKSRWETPKAGQTTRRLYTLTPKGRRALES